MTEHDDDTIFDTDEFYKRLMEKMFREMKEFEKAVESGKLPGEWEVKQIDKPGVKGYVAKGSFQLGEPLQIPKHAADEVREPLTDVFEDDDNVKLYVELPGVDKNDIQFNLTDGRAEVKAKNFHKIIELPMRNVNFEKATATHKNGVLEVTIPRIKETVEEEKKRTIKIE